jgi:hypothetical protein
MEGRERERWGREEAGYNIFFLVCIFHLSYYLNQKTLPFFSFFGVIFVLLSQEARRR